jgi:hypothetical protein
VGLPVPDGGLGHTKPLGHIALQQAKIETPLSQVVAERLFGVWETPLKLLPVVS